ncbi:response regulator receiver modulated diguanylate cyclase [Sulfurimonas gotlandica GD1]|uniref:diguanylate cyclase n=1 Tax=Sulfurimonas gotlandica (strain DSM 19862 / JCM 16533 / GD1) TaxID=929558 RepID=B6BIE6_SULGG|nr:diguanylate cyclase [Sulfurimonas gotlandica]EDZ63466.1 response regulator PleD [Sulfurimonas gotlandica GD1]EHP30300.1 response regulator receiver modulated diguanylate cyclase [Sulfurimonas gotlandica GD1]
MKEKAVVLIVDDVASNVQILAEVLKDEYHIKVAVDGRSAIELSTKKPYPDLILLDVNMPDMDGYDVLRELKRCVGSDSVPVIFVTGNDTEEDEEKGLLLGAVDYIKKPIHPAIVKARVRTQVTLKKQRDELIYNAVHDQLTGLYNRNHLVLEGERKFSRAFRKNDKLSVMMIDIDHFKIVNDTHGHLTGDLVLKEVASLLIQDNRTEDFSARFGGEEFIVVLDGCSKEDAKEKAETLRKKIEELNPADIKVTASFGISELNKEHNSFESLLRAADSALYSAKSSGRNCVVVA